MHIDWDNLAKKLGRESQGGTHYAREALSDILSEEAIIEAVEHYISGETGSELARDVLWHIHPKSGMDYCYKIYKEDPDIERRRLAVELLRVVADDRALRWAGEFLNDPDPEIQNWGAGLVDQLLFSNLVQKKDCTELLEIMKNHESKNVRGTYEFILGYLNKNES